MHQVKLYFSVPIKEAGEQLLRLNEKEFVLPPGDKEKIVVREKVAKLLHGASKKLPVGYKFNIYDAWRSKKAQKGMIVRFKKKIKNENPTWDKKKIDIEILKYAAPVVSDPNKPPPHNTGGALDLTIVDKSGNSLPMGGEAGELSEKSTFDFYKGSETLLDREFHANRLLLRKALNSVDFAPNDNEWWHFDYGNQRWAHYYKQPFAYYGGLKAPGEKAF